MDTAFNFLLQNWLWVGLEVLIFFGIGLLFAKLIWGRQSRRVSFAVDECMNLSGQWYALGSSQRDLFKKLSSRWQDDRESWERQLRRMADDLAEKDELILRLEEGGAGGSSSDAENELKKARKTIEDLERRLSDPTDSDSSPTSFSEETETLKERIAELENDLVDAHDKLHEMRSESAGSSTLIPFAVESRKAEPGVDFVALERSNAQLNALLALREREIVFIRESVSIRDKAPSDSSPVTEVPAEKGRLAEVEAELEKEIEDHADTVQGLYQRISELEEQLLEQEDRISDSSRAVAGFGETFIHPQKEIEDSVEKSAVIESAAKLEEARAEIADLKKQVRTQEEELISIRKEMGSKEESSGELEKLKCELKDAYDEMSDVRLGYNKQLKQLEAVDLPPENVLGLSDRIVDLESTLQKAEEELKKLRRKHHESSSEEEKLRHENDELEAIVRDRDAEVDDAVSELRSSKETLRSLRVKIAQQEGDLEGLTEVNRKMESELREKRSVADMLTGRISEVEKALSDRYEEMNRLSAALDQTSGGYEKYAEEAKGLSKELSEVRWENGLLRKKVEELEASVDAGQEGFEETVRELEERRLSVRLLEDRYRLTKDEVREVQDSLQLAQSELDAARKELEERERNTLELEKRIETLNAELEVKEQSIREFKNLAEGRRITLTEKDEDLNDARETVAAHEAELGEVKERLSSLESQLKELNGAVSEKNEEIASLQEGNRGLEEQVSEKESKVAELESTVCDLRNRVDETSNTSDFLKTQLSETKVSLEDTQGVLDKKTRQLGDFSERLHRLIHSDEGGDSPIYSNELGSGEDSSGDSQFEALGAAISELESRAVRAEQSYGVCEQELLEAKQSVVMAKQQHQVELSRRDREIEILREQVFVAEEQKVQAIRALEERVQEELASAGEVSEGQVQKLKTLVATLREEIAARDLAIRELEDQSDYERSREALRDEHVVEAPVERRNVRRSVPHHSTAGATSENAFLLYFEEGYAHLTGSSIDQIDRFSREYRNSGSRENISIAGYAGDEGSNALNESLSARRADAVRERLVENGIPQGKIVVQARGHDGQAREGDDRWKARRVEVVIVPEAVAETIN